MKRTDWLLLTIAAGKGAGLTPVQLQKSLFLLGRFLPQDVGPSYYRFIPYNYGPFCVDVYRDAEKLEREGLVNIPRPEGNLPTYRVAKVGEDRARRVARMLSLQQSEYVRRVVEWTQSLSFPALVRAIYQQFPEFKQNSVFQG